MCAGGRETVYFVAVYRIYHSILEAAFLKALSSKSKPISLVSRLVIPRPRSSIHTLEFLFPPPLKYHGQNITATVAVCLSMHLHMLFLTYDWGNLRQKCFSFHISKKFFIYFYVWSAIVPYTVSCSTFSGGGNRNSRV